MSRVRLIHWNENEAEERAAQLRDLKFKVIPDRIRGPDDLRELKQNPPAAVVIDLSRLPSQGRDVALALRGAKATRFVPLVFVDGAAEKVARVKAVLPDAVYTTWRRIGPALRRAIAKPPQHPVVPSSQLAGYSGTPLPKKLGIKSNMVVTLIAAPPGFEEILGELPEGVRFRKHARGRCDLAIWFVTAWRELENRIDKVADLPWDAALWIAWPKKASGLKTDVTQNDVRKIGLAAGLVDYKICAIDETWSGLKFTRRKS